MAASRVAPTATSVRGAQPPYAALKLGVGARRVLWSLLVGVQLVNAALLACLALVYFYRNTRGSLLWTAALYYLFADAYAFVDRYFLAVAVAYAVLSAAFALSGLRLVGLSLRRRRLKFGASVRSQRGSVVRSKSQILSAVLAPFRATEPTQSSRWHRFREWTDAVLFTVGVEGPLFDLRLLIDRIVGVTTQTVAAYVSSHSISNVYLNQMYGVVLFLSCVSPPVCYWVFRADRTKRRIAYLVADLVLDFIWGTIIPIWMYIPIVKMYYSTLTESMGDTTTSAREIRRVLVISWSNLVLSLIPFMISLVSSLEIQAVLIDRWSPQASTKVALPPITSTGTASPKRSVHVNPVMRAPKKRAWAHLFGLAHGAIALYGCVMLVVSLFASGMFGLVVNQPQFPCVFRLNPWFSTKEACIKRFVNCTEVGIEGSRTEIDAALNFFDASSLSELYFKSCSALDISSSLRRFSVLTTIVIEESWINEWPLSASITRDHFAALKTVKLLSVDTNATLHGLISVPIAATVEYIRFYDVPKAETILSSVGSNWRHLKYFDCDSCGLSEVPLAVDTMYKLLTLSLAESHIAELRDGWIQRWNVKLIGLWMDSNEELTELSTTVWRQAATCSMFSMQFTNLSTIPDWLLTTARKDFVVYGYGSPLCDENTSASQISSKLRKFVSCEYQDG